MPVWFFKLVDTSAWFCASPRPTKPLAIFSACEVRSDFSYFSNTFISAFALIAWNPFASSIKKEPCGCCIALSTSSVIVLTNCLSCCLYQSSVLLLIFTGLNLRIFRVFWLFKISGKFINIFHFLNVFSGDIGKQATFAQFVRNLIFV